MKHVVLRDVKWLHGNVGDPCKFLAVRADQICSITSDGPGTPTEATIASPNGGGVTVSCGNDFEFLVQQLDAAMEGGNGG